MTTDELRHLLEMAARACGAQIEPCVCSSQPFRFKSTGGHWNPHVDDGMSARMRTALRMNVLWSDTAVHCLNSMGEAFESFANHNGDRNAALRLCALRVAAEIGEGMHNASIDGAEELDRLRAELEIARNDAERYRWLRRRIRLASEQMMTGEIKKCLTVRVAYSVMDRTDDPADSYLSKDRFDADCATLDAAIDAALAKAGVV